MNEAIKKGQKMADKYNKTVYICKKTSSSKDKSDYYPVFAIDRGANEEVAKTITPKRTQS